MYTQSGIIADNSYERSNIYLIFIIILLLFFYYFAVQRTLTSLTVRSDNILLKNFPTLPMPYIQLHTYYRHPLYIMYSLYSVCKYHLLG